MIVLLDATVDGGFKLDDGVEDAASQAAGQRREEALRGVVSGAGLGGGVEGPARLTRQPALNLGMGVGSVVVDNGMDELVRRDGSIDRIEETEGHLVAMALHTVAQHRAVEYVQRGQQGGCSYGSWDRTCRDWLASRAWCGQAPGSASSRRSRAPRHGPAGRSRSTRNLGHGRCRQRRLASLVVQRHLDALFGVANLPAHTASMMPSGKV